MWNFSSSAESLKSTWRQVWPPLTQLAVEGSCRQKSVDPELQQLPGRCRHLLVRVIRQDFLDHKTPVAVVSPVVRVNRRRIVVRPHVQRMLHGRDRSRALYLSLSFRGLCRLSWSPQWVFWRSGGSRRLSRVSTGSPRKRKKGGTEKGFRTQTNLFNRVSIRKKIILILLVRARVSVWTIGMWVRVFVLWQCVRRIKLGLLYGAPWWLHLSARWSRPCKGRARRLDFYARGKKLRLRGENVSEGQWGNSSSHVITVRGGVGRCGVKEVTEVQMKSENSRGGRWWY